MKKIFMIPVTWIMTNTINVSADDLAEAVVLAESVVQNQLPSHDDEIYTHLSYKIDYDKMRT